MRNFIIGFIIKDDSLVAERKLAARQRSGNHQISPKNTQVARGSGAFTGTRFTTLQILAEYDAQPN
jgi:hypothetical protein